MLDYTQSLIDKVIDCCGLPEKDRDVTESDIEEMVELAIAAHNQRKAYKEKYIKESKC